MRKHLSIGALVAALVGLAASLATAIDDLGPKATFCAETGCEIVRSSSWAKPLGIPMSVLGVAFFGAMVALAFVPHRLGVSQAAPTRRSHFLWPRLRLALALVGGAWAIFLIVLQAAVIGAWCKLCLVADPAAIVLAICVAAGATTFEPRWQRLAALVPAVGAIVVVLAMWTKAPSAPPPPADTPQFVLDAQTKDTVTIVEALDFECPHCREMNKRLEEAKARTKVPVRIVRKMMPLPMHPGAVPAAIAYCCADMQGKGEQMAKLLFEADPSDLTAKGCQRMAKEAGCDLDRFLADVQVAVKRVQGEMMELKAAKITSLPTMFIGHDRHVGAGLTVDELVAEIEKHAP